MPEAKATLLGIPHLQAMWSRATNARSGAVRGPEVNDQWGADTTLIYALGLGLAETMQYLYGEAPSLEQFERWVLDKNGGYIAPARINQINAALSPNVLSNAPAIQEGPLTPADLSFWNENGFVVLHNAVSDSSCGIAVAAICEFLHIDLNRPDTWYNGPQGHSIWVPLLRHPAIEANRDSTRIRQAFAQIWGRGDLVMTIDQSGMNPPERPGWRFPGPHLHWDTSLELPVPLGVQGILYLTDTAADQGAFTCVPGFHRHIETWLNDLPPGSNPREQNLAALGAVPIAGKAGDLIIWHHALPHGSSPNVARLPRFVQYMTMKPALWADNRAWR